MEQQPNKIRPMLLSALAQLSACLIVWNFHIPNPNILLFVVLSAVLVKYGYAAGIVSSLIAFLYSAFFFSTDHSFFLYTSLNFQKFIVIGLGIAANILLIGRLQWQFERSSIEKMQAEAEEKLQETTESYRAKLYHDVLTGTYNRRYYEDIASRIVGPAGIALIDVDDFKICNDTYGHYAGDMALETAANAIRSCIRNADLLIRYGGHAMAAGLSVREENLPELRRRLNEWAARECPVLVTPPLECDLSIHLDRITVESVRRLDQLAPYGAENPAPVFLLEKAVERILTVTGEAFEGDDTQKAMQAERAVTDMTNDLLKKNADALKMGTIETAKESQRGVVDIETLQQTNKSLIETLDELNKIQTEGRAKRVAAEQELTRIEDELKQKMMEIRS